MGAIFFGEKDDAFVKKEKKRKELSSAGRCFPGSKR